MLAISVLAQRLQVGLRVAGNRQLGAGEQALAVLGERGCTCGAPAPSKAVWREMEGAAGTSEHRIRLVKVPAAQAVCATPPHPQDHALLPKAHQGTTHTRTDVVPFSCLDGGQQGGALRRSGHFQGALQKKGRDKLGLRQGKKESLAWAGAPARLMQLLVVHKACAQSEVGWR